MADSPHSPTPSVFREFTDSRGVHWRIWKVTPSDSELGISTTAPRNAEGSPARSARRERDAARRREWTQGWLLFESSREKKRLFPIPDGWTTASAGALEAMCDSAKPVR